MAKGDFNIEEPDYYADDESISEDNLDKNSEETVKQEPKKTTPTDLYRQDYGENSDFSNIGVNKDALHTTEAINNLVLAFITINSPLN